MKTHLEKSTSESKPTRLIIQLPNLKASNETSGKGFQVRNITISRSRSRGTRSYYELTNFSRSEHIEIAIRSGSKIEKIDLPMDMLKRIAIFIREDNKRKAKFDCSSFVHFINGIPYRFNQFLEEKWEIISFNEKKLVPGNTIMISEDPERNNIVHLGLYLGKGLYLSKFGDKGKLIATTLEEMKKGFVGNYIFQIKPR